MKYGLLLGVLLSSVSATADQFVLIENKCWLKNYSLLKNGLLVEEKVGESPASFILCEQEKKNKYKCYQKFIDSEGVGHHMMDREEITSEAEPAFALIREDKRLLYKVYPKKKRATTFYIMKKNGNDIKQGHGCLGHAYPLAEWEILRKQIKDQVEAVKQNEKMKK